MAKKLSAALAFAVIGAWLLLYFSGRGLLIGYTQPEGGIGMLGCRYFTGASVVDRSYLYTTQGMLGRDTCPRILDVTK